MDIRRGLSTSQTFPAKVFSVSRIRGRDGISRQWRNMKARYCLPAVLLISQAFGTTIISQLNNGPTVSGDGTGIGEVSWTETGSYSNVGIFANIFAGGASASGTAYLMNMIGSGASAANEVVAPVPFSVTGIPGVNVMTTIFSGLSLTAGTYYLILDPDAGNVVAWNLAGVPLVVEDTGVTGGMSEAAVSINAFAPASTFQGNGNNFIYEVTGTVGTASTVPEPSTWAMLLMGAAALTLSSGGRRWLVRIP
jgi:PEP-CTERM motif